MELFYSKLKYSQLFITRGINMCGSRCGYRGPDPLSLKNHKNIGILSNTSPDP